MQWEITSRMLANLQNTCLKLYRLVFKRKKKPIHVEFSRDVPINLFQQFITLMDTLRLNRYAVDELHPILADLIQSLNNMPGLPADFEGKAKVRQWLITLHSMKASDEITEEQARQMLFEMEQSHTEFYRLISGEQKGLAGTE